MSKESIKYLLVVENLWLSKQCASRRTEASNYSLLSYEAFDSFKKMPLGLNLLSVTWVSGVARDLGC